MSFGVQALLFAKTPVYRQRYPEVPTSSRLMSFMGERLGTSNAQRAIRQQTG